MESKGLIPGCAKRCDCYQARNLTVSGPHACKESAGQSALRSQAEGDCVNLRGESKDAMSVSVSFSGCSTPSPVQPSNVGIDCPSPSHTSVRLSQPFRSRPLSSTLRKPRGIASTQTCYPRLSPSASKAENCQSWSFDSGFSQLKLRSEVIVTSHVGEPQSSVDCGHGVGEKAAEMPEVPELESQCEHRRKMKQLTFIDEPQLTALLKAVNRSHVSAKVRAQDLWCSCVTM